MDSNYFSCCSELFMANLIILFLLSFVFCIQLMFRSCGVFHPIDVLNPRKFVLGSILFHLV